MVLNPRCEVWKFFDNNVEEGVAVCKLCKQRLKNERSYSLRKHINKLHNPNSEIWKHFDNIVDESVAVCKICNKRVRNNRHFNLILHLKQHDIIVDNGGNESQSKTIQTSKKLDDTNLKTIITREAWRDKSNLFIEMDEKTLARAVIGLIIEEGISPKIFCSKNMQALLSPICDAIAKQELIKLKVDDIQSEKVICSVANHIRNEFCNDLHWRLLSLKIDRDLDARSSSFSLSVQFIEKMKVETRTLGVIRLDENQVLTGQHIMEILHNFNIDSKQIVSASWDNTKEKYYNFILNSEYLREIEIFEKNSDIYIGDIKLERYIGTIAQLCMLDVLKNPNIFELYLECRKLVKFLFDYSSLFCEEFKQSNLNVPKLDSPWEFGSTYSMMNDLKEACTLLDNMKYEQPPCPEDQFKFDDNLKNFIEAFCKALNFVQRSLIKFYSEEMHFGDFYAQWLKCKLVTEKLLFANAKQENHLKTILLALQKSIEYRSNELLNQDHFKACLYLDPRFQHTLNLPEKMFALEYINQLWDRSKIYNAELTDPVTVSQQKTVSSTQQIDVDEDEDAFLNEFLCQGAKENEVLGIYKKLEDLKLPFQMVDTDILSFWQELKNSEPEIYILSTICFAIPATQIYKKIRYTHLDDVNNMNLPPFLKKNITFIRLNEYLLNETVNKLGLFREDDSSDNEVSDNNSEADISMPTRNTIPANAPSNDGNLPNVIVKSEIDDMNRV